MQKEMKKLQFYKRMKINLWCWTFLVPALIFYILFQGWPIITSIYYSFLDWSGMTSSATFVGLQNYTKLLSDMQFWHAFKNSFLYAALFVPIELVASLFFAYLLNNEIMKARTVYRTLLFAPVITTTSIVGIIMVFIWSVQGPVNVLLTHMGILSKAINFLGNGKYALGTVLFIGIWKDLGTYMIYWLAGLQSVPKDVIEAASVDGASNSKTFFKIVFPMIKPVAGVIAILCFINALKVFDIVKTMTDGGPFFSTDVIATFVYRIAFSSEMGMPRLGYASAAANIFGIVVIVIGVILNIIKNRLNAKVN